MMRGFLLLLFLLVPLIGSIPAAAQDAEAKSRTDAAVVADRNRAQVIQKASAASICVFSVDGKGGGSGVVVTPDGFALTNYHVVKPCGAWMHCSLPDGELYDAVLVGIDPTGDIALIRLLGRDDFPTAEMADSDLVRTGDPCFAIGNPFLLATNFEPSVSWGIVSGVHRYQYPAGTLLEYTDCIQTDAAINPGNSGGPLFNGQGQLIGINGRGSFEKRNRVNVGVGYAISINQVKLFWHHLMSGRVVDHATLGAVVTTDARGQVVVDNILGTSDAWRRGLRYNDEIVSFAGRSIESVNEFKNVLGIYPKGWRVPLEYRRDGVLYQATVRLEGVHSDQGLSELVEGRSKPESKVPRLESLSRKPRVPDNVAALIEARPGYANYFFNREQAAEVLNRFRMATGAGTVPAGWRVTSTLPDQTPVQFALDVSQAGIQWDESAAVLNSDQDLAAQILPAGSGGLLPALFLWHRWMTQGPEAFGEVFYSGALPTRSGQLAQVLIARFESVESRMFFDMESGLLVAMEMWTDPGTDPCELEFGNYVDVAGVNLPYQVRARCGDHFDWNLSVSGFDVNGGAE